MEIANRYGCDKPLRQSSTLLNMIDTMGYGIHSMNVGQAKRYLPLPDNDLSDRNAVKLTLYGSFIDTEYSQTLYQNKELPFEKVMQLDKESKTRVKTREETTVKTKVKTKVKILDLIAKKPGITREELAKTLELSIDGIDWNLRELKKARKLRRIGSKKGGYWEVVSDETEI
ncbi:winged helix-turn-helix transcriptional regulator [bacterium]|nr:winged helix-turn-helix transcriptional regulator [bacterium]